MTLNNLTEDKKCCEKCFNRDITYKGKDVYAEVSCFGANCPCHLEPMTLNEYLEEFDREFPVSLFIEGMYMGAEGDAEDKRNNIKASIRNFYITKLEGEAHRILAGLYLINNKMAHQDLHPDKLEEIKNELRIGAITQTLTSYTLSLAKERVANLDGMNGLVEGQEETPEYYTGYNTLRQTLIDQEQELIKELEG